MLLQVPDNAQTYELLNSLIWVDQEGIVYSKPKQTEYIQQTKENIAPEIRRFKDIVGDKKVRLIVEAHPKAKPIQKKDRLFIAEQYAGIIEAMAIITTSPVAKMITNIFFSFNPPPYPIKMFSKLDEAKTWLNNKKNKTGNSPMRLVA